MNRLKGSWNTSKTFLQEVVSEMRKVSFPSRQEVVGTTIVVIVTSIIFAVYLAVADQLIIWGYNSLAKVFG
jgi:preprotein translocase subunit SecE